MFFTIILPIILVLCSNTLMIFALRKQNREHDIHIKRQRRATLIVIIIASTFTITQIPSAIIHIISLIKPDLQKLETFRIIVISANSLVIMGKTANFFLFCTWSSYFRKNLNRVISMKMPCLYRFCEKGITRFRSNSSLRDSSNRRLSKLKLQRLQSMPTSTPIHLANLKSNNSFPLNGNRGKKIEQMMEETQIDETSAFLEEEPQDHRLTIVTDL